MRRIVIATAVSIGVVSLAAIASADTLIMRDGTRISGRVVSVAARTITFADSSGVSRRYNASQVDALEFTQPIPRHAAVGTSGNGRADTGGSRRMEMLPSGSAVIIGVVLSVTALVAQTVITPPDNKYTPAQDVELGRQAATEAEHQLPMLRDEVVTSWVASVGRRIVDAIPEELRHAEFRYTFQVVNVREINAFALPGGPMYFMRSASLRATAFRNTTERSAE